MRKGSELREEKQSMAKEEATGKVVRDIRRKTRRRFSAEEEIKQRTMRKRKKEYLAALAA